MMLLCHSAQLHLVLARYGCKENDAIQYDITQNIAIRYDMIRCINSTSNLTRSNKGVSSSMNVCCCCSRCEPGRYSRTTIAAKQPTRARAQTISNVVGWSAMSIDDNAISTAARMATPPWLTDRSSAVCGRARSTTLYKGLFTLCTLMDADVPKGRMSTSVTARQHASTSIDMREHPSTHATAHWQIHTTYTNVIC